MFSIYYLSAQPDNSYFLWQIKVMLFNFERLGIPSDNIQVVVGYDPKRGINPAFSEFDKSNGYGHFYFYPDNRRSKIYKSSIRPHILAQHFKKHPQLASEAFFYHDCDIIFRERLGEGILVNDTACYVSDASGYMNLQYINKFDGAFKLMAHTMKMDERLVEVNDGNTGGAQYVLKNIDAQFWKKLEKDCEKLYVALVDFNKGKEKQDQIQAWCADMWAIYWNLLKRGDKVRIHKELDFCWPKNKLDRWTQTKILHNAGVKPEEKVAFCKGHFVTSDPFFRDFEEFPQDTCTIKYVDEIKAYEKYVVSKSFSDLTFTLPLNRNSNASKEVQKEIRQNIVEL